MTRANVRACCLLGRPATSPCVERVHICGLVERRKKSASSPCYRPMRISSAACICRAWWVVPARLLPVRRLNSIERVIQLSNYPLRLFSLRRLLRFQSIFHRAGSLILAMGTARRLLAACRPAQRAIAALVVRGTAPASRGLTSASTQLLARAASSAGCVFLSSKFSGIVGSKKNSICNAIFGPEIAS